MGCRYSSFDGYCKLWEEGDNLDCMGFDYDTGACVCQYDTDPSYTCESYESDGSD